MYAGVDKYGGALAGEGQPRDGSGGPAAPTGLSLEEAIETAAAEETVVVDVPFQYYEDEEDSSTLVTGSSQVLLAAQLNPSGGGLMWLQQDDAQDTYKNVVAMSQMTSMLRDTDRNRCYERGIQSAIELFKRTHDGRAPIVLDIGTGTGLLSMFAARHGAEHVYACEMFKPMAEIAQHVTADNFPDKITVLAMRSTELTIARDGVEGHLPRRADMLVSELFDSILLGEAVIPTIRHAMEHLLVPNAVVVPERATVFAHVVECESMYRMSSFAGAYLNEEKGIRLARNDAAWECTGSKPALPLHIDAFKDEAVNLTTSTPVLFVDFTTLPAGVEPLGVRSEETTVAAVQSGKAHAVLMWWEVSFDKDDAVVYSTQPRVQNWQDHWVQVVFPLANALDVAANDTLTLRAHHDDLRVWFDVDKATAGVSSPSKSRLPLKRRIDGGSASDAAAEKAPCVCGLHLLCNAERVSMLTDKQRTQAFDRAIEKTIVKLASERACTPKDLACLDVSDGSLCALLAAAHGLENVTSVESKDVSARIFQQLCDGNVPDTVEVMCCGCKGLLPEHLKNEKPADLLVGEVFYYSMQNLPLWQALNFWLRRSVLTPTLAPGAVVLPARARVLALPVAFEHLHECFGAVGGEVSGFDHSYFDQFQGGYYTRNFPFPAYMYPYTAITTEPIELAAWKYLDEAHSISSELSVVLPEANGAPNAVIVWVEYAVDEEGEHIVATGPAVRYAKQLIRFLAPQDQSAVSVKLMLHAQFAFNAVEGDVVLSFELSH